MRDLTRQHPLRVVMHPLGLSPELQPYIWLLANALNQRGIDLVPYRTVDVLRTPPDVIHFHWPEHTLYRSTLRRIVRGLLLLSTLKLARMRGTVLMLTVHNAQPHDLSLRPFDRWFLRAFDRQVDGVLTLSGAGWPAVAQDRPALSKAVITHTRHGHFRDAYPPPPSQQQARRRIGMDTTLDTVVFAGQVRSYKGVPELLEAAHRLDVQVLVAGACPDERLKSQLEALAKRDSRVTLRLRYLRPEELTDAVAAATVVALPYRKVLNSGSAMLGLSLGRRVILPSTHTFRELRAEVGGRWVHLFDGDQIAAADIEAALEDLPTDPPDLASYEWSEIADATVTGYQRTVAAHRAPSRDPNASPHPDG